MPRHRRHIRAVRRSFGYNDRRALFGHIIRSDYNEDHTRALNAGIDDPPKEWRRPRGRPRQTWLRTVEQDLKQQHLGLWSARHRAYDRDLWCDIVETATSLEWRGMPHDDDDDDVQREIESSTYYDPTWPRTLN